MTTILITGANRGIGLELAKDAISRKWRVFGSVRSKEQAQALDETTKGKATALVFDVTDYQKLQLVAAQLDVPIDILINNAGIIGPTKQSTLDMDFEGFAQTLEVNTLAPLAVSQAFLPHLKRAERGRIVTISSQMSWMGYAKSDRIAYRASKSAVNKVMQGLATDLSDTGIPVALIDPGWVQTDMGGSDANNDPADVARGILSVAETLSLGQTGRFFKWSGEEREF